MKTIKKIKLIDFNLSKSIWNRLFWFYKYRFYWNGIDFKEHREYNFWDSIKFIDWKASSKSEKIYTKIFEETRDLKVLFLLDLNESMFFNIKKRTKIDVLEDVFYSLSFSAYKNNDSIWAYLFWDFKTKYISYKKNVWNIFKTIEYIEKIRFKNSKNKSFFSSFKNKQTSSLLDVIEILLDLKTKDNLIFILTDNLEATQNIKKLKSISLKNEVFFINIFDYFENNLEKIPSNIVFENAWDFLDISLKNDNLIRKYSSLRNKKQQYFDNIMKKNNIKTMFLDTKMNVFKELLRNFR